MKINRGAAIKGIRHAFAAVMLVACASPAPGEPDGGREPAGDVALQTSILAGKTTLARGPLATLVDRRLEDARKAKAGERGRELLAVAGLAEHLYRLTHKSADGQRALAIYTDAAAEGDATTACDASLRNARLAGEIAGDARQTYVGLFRVGERARAKQSDACAATVDAELALLRAFRPTEVELEAARAALVLEGIPVNLANKNAAHITRIEHTNSPDAARIVAYLDKAVPYKIADYDLGKGSETTIEFEGAELANGRGEAKALAGIAEAIRLETTNAGARVAIALHGKVYRKVFHLTEPFRVVLDLARTPPVLASRAVEKVVIDAGHGGTDPGAIGAGGLHEKDVTLDLARRVAQGLVARGIRVFLTREDDTYVALEERTARANAVGADLFLSIHCNAAENRGKHGIESYVLSSTAADIAAHVGEANRLAARENSATEQATVELSSRLAGGPPNHAGGVLADDGARSRKFADLLQRSALASLTGYGSVVDGGVKPAGFYVLVGARMPGVLFEASYISNESEEQRLATPAYKDRLADAMVNAVLAYRQGK